MNVRIIRRIIALILCFLSFNAIEAQKFSVESFRELPTDVSAFIQTVRDNNDEDCALIKVIAPEDFVFSTPLGIVKREEHTGEIWLFIPARSKKITIKHAEWGVLRDYQFPTKIVSHFVYELRLRIPEPTTTIREIITTITDTLILTRIDTLKLEQRPAPTPLQVSALTSLAFGTRNQTLAPGLMFVAMKSIGAFLHLSSNLKSMPQTIGECERHGEIGNRKPFYSGEARRSLLIANIGASHRLSSHIILFEGFGYGHSTLAWQLAPSEGGGYLKNNYYSSRGVSFEAGAIFTHRSLMLSISVISIQGREWLGSIGIGLPLCSFLTSKSSRDE